MAKNIRKYFQDIFVFEIDSFKFGACYITQLDNFKKKAQNNSIANMKSESLFFKFYLDSSNTKYIQFFVKYEYVMGNIQNSNV